MLATIAAACGASLGRWAISVASTLTGRQPCSLTSATAPRSSTRLSAPW